jgi:hypothetical protein
MKIAQMLYRSDLILAVRWPPQTNSRPTRPKLPSELTQQALIVQQCHSDQSPSTP